MKSEARVSTVGFPQTSHVGHSLQCVDMCVPRLSLPLLALWTDSHSLNYFHISHMLIPSMQLWIPKLDFLFLNFLADFEAQRIKRTEC